MAFTSHDLIAQIPNALGALGMYHAGKKRRFGWLLGVLSEIAWVGYAIVISAPGLYPWAAAWAVVYAKNWIQWREQKDAAPTGQATPPRA
jgi:hypothetical protein